MTDTYSELKIAADDAYKRGDYASAAAGYKNALALDPKNSDLGAIYARAAGASGDLAESYNVARSILDWRPDHALALATACSAAFALSRWPVVAELGPRWLEHGGDKLRASRMLSQAYVELGQMNDARDLYLAVVEDDAANPEKWANYARICLGAFDYDGAKQAIETAHELAPPSAASLFTLARMYYFLGRMDEAEKYCVEAIEKDPAFASAFTLLTTIRRGDISDDVLEAMRKLSTQGETPPGHRSSLNFSIGEALHRRAHYEDAMSQLKAGNDLASKLLEAQDMAYRPETERKALESATALYAALPAPLETTAGAQPIFVVGMPRSGTTLIESILAEHEDVHGAGELQSMPSIHKQLLTWSASNGNAPLSNLPRAELERARDWYLDALPRQDSRFVVDKQPLNFTSVPLTRVLFPASPIVHTRRNAIDTGFSIFRLDFAKTWPYATSFEDIADFYGAYARWADAHIGEENLFQYETLIADFEPEARRLLDHCGLEWRDACLNFHQSSRPVATFSAAQVREPLRKEAISAEALYGALLDPLKTALMDEGIDVKTGGLAR